MYSDPNQTSLPAAGLASVRKLEGHGILDLSNLTVPGYAQGLRSEHIVASNGIYFDGTEQRSTSADYGELTTDSSAWVKRFSHRARFECALNLIDIRSSDSLIDYGTGNGYFPLLVASRYERPEVWAYEPFVNLRTQLHAALKNAPRFVPVVANPYEIPDKHFSIVTCFEVLEHLKEERQRAVLQDLKRIACPGATFLISVPIETGLTALLKNAARVAIGSSHSGTTVSSVFRSMLSLPVRRKDADYIPSHIGFNYRHLTSMLADEGFTIEKTIFSPLPALKGALNSQVIYRLKAK